MCPLPTQYFLKIFEKARVHSLYWYAVELETSRLRKQKWASFSSKFNPVFDELTLGFCKSKKVVENLKKLESSLKT